MVKEIRTTEITHSITILKKEITFSEGEKLVCYVKAKKESDETVYEYVKLENDLPNRVLYYKDGNIKREEWIDDYSREEDLDYDDLEYLERDNDPPNFITYYENGNIKYQKWLIDYDIEDGYSYMERKTNFPNFIKYYETGNIENEKWLEFDRTYLSRKNDMPSEINYYKTGTVKSLKWGFSLYTSSEKRPDDQPNYIEYYEDGKIKCEKWLSNRSCLDENYEVRLNGKSNFIEYTDKGKVEKWLIKNNEYMYLGPNTPNVITRLTNGRTEKFIIGPDGDPIKMNYNFM